MESRRIVLFVLALGSLSLSSGKEDAFDRLLPKVMSRFKDLREALLPVSDDTLQEALFHAGTFYIPVDSESELCRNHSSLLFDSFLQYDLWALRMVDASSKLPSGILDGNHMDLGSYDQCLSVEAPDKLFRGQHCVIETTGIFPGATDDINPERQFLRTFRMDTMFSVCVPSSCTSRDVSTHIDVTLNSINASAIVFDTNCSTALPLPLHRLDLAAIFIILSILVMVVLSTVYDIKSVKHEKSEALSSFSLNRNLSHLLDMRSSSAALPCLNGIRVLAIAWVIAGHRMLTVLSFPNLRLKTVAENIHTLRLTILESAQLAVEVFFLLSGVLVSYSYLRYRQKSQKVNLTYFYLYRYLRLTPALAFMILLYLTLIVRLGDGPLWRRAFGIQQDFCEQNWWTNLLYINNYYKPFEMCMTQTWFLASDFQMYFFSPLLLIPLHKSPRVGLTLTAFLFVLTTAGGLWNSFYHELKAGGPVTQDRRTEETMVKDYIVAHVRAASFLMGIALGYLLLQIKLGQLVIKLSSRTLCAGWLASVVFILFSVMFVTVFQQPDYVYTPWLDTLYLVLHRHIFSLAICWIIIVCTLEYGGVVNKFLTWPVWTPLTRLTYCVFLTHLFIQTLQTNSQRSPITFNNWFDFWYHFFADFTFSHVAAAALYLTVEAPCTNLTHWLFQGGKKRKQDPS